MCRFSTFVAAMVFLPALIAQPVGSSITGRVFDADGKPIPKAQVTAYLYGYYGGVRSLTSAGYTSSTDANGMFSLGVPKGRYYIRLEDPIPAVYYPGTLDPAAAAPIDVDAEAKRSGIDIRRVDVPVFHIRGRAVTANGEVAANAALTILDEQPIQTMRPPATVPTAADGSFEFKNLLPGRYVIRANPRGGTKYAGRASVSITRDNIDDLIFAVNEGYRLAGKIKMEDETALPAPPSSLPGFSLVRIGLLNADQIFTSGEIGANPDSKEGSFLIEHIPPAKYYIRMGFLPEDVYIKSIRNGVQEVTRSLIDLTYGGGDDLEVVLGSKPGTVNATVRNSKGEVMERVPVALWPGQARYGHHNVVRAGCGHQ